MSSLTKSGVTSIASGSSRRYKSWDGWFVQDTSKANSRKLQRFFINLKTFFYINKEKRENIRRKLIADNKKRYLKKYLYCLEETKKNKYISELTNKTIKINKTVWLCWFQGEENAPEIVRICIKNIKKYIPNDYDFKIITDKNINDFIKLPDYILKKRKKNIIQSAHFADIIRVFLLNPSLLKSL